jgi:hypothetical protein
VQSQLMLQSDVSLTFLSSNDKVLALQEESKVYFPLLPLKIIDTLAFGDRSSDGK